MFIQWIYFYFLLLFLIKCQFNSHMTTANAVQIKEFIKNETNALKNSKDKIKKKPFFSVGNKNNNFIENVTNETKVLFTEIRSKLEKVKRNEGQLSKSEFVNLWNIVAHYWTIVINTTEVIQEVVENSELFERSQKFVEVTHIDLEDYNALVTRNLKIPGKIININSDLINNITKPLQISRARFVVARDLILEAFESRQVAAWSPIVLKSQELARFNRKISDDFNEFLGRVFFNKFSQHLYDFRVAVRLKDDKRIRETQSTILCLINQRCCGDPSPCIGLVTAKDSLPEP